MTSSWPRSAGCTGSTPSGFTAPSTTSRPSSSRPPIITTRTPTSRLESNELSLHQTQGVSEFKSTARWGLVEGKPNKAMEDAVVKTVAGFLNTDGGTLLIGVEPNRNVIGLHHDYARVKPSNGDGFVNWLTTHLVTALGHAAVMRTRARITQHEGHDVCRLDVARSSQPVWAKTSKAERVFYIRMNNSTRELPDTGLAAEELAAYQADRWPDHPPEQAER